MNFITQIRKNKHYKITTPVKNYLNPDYIYIPINSKVNIQITNHQNIYKGSIILKQETKYYYSSVSGTIIGATKVKNYLNKTLDAIVIENNFMEKHEKRVGAKKYINHYSEDDVRNLVSKYNASKRELVGSTLIVNGIDTDPFEENYSYIIKKYSAQLLECIDALGEIFHLQKIFLAIKNSDSENVQLLVNNIGTYPNINLKLMPDFYPIGKKEILIKKLTNEKMRKNGILYFNIEEILAIYEVLKRKQPLSEKLVTISGELVEEPVIVNTKIGVLVKDLLENNVKILSSDYIIVANGLLAGHEIDENCVITKEIRSIFIVKKIKEEEKKCINCGLCYANCPVNINPKYIHEHQTPKSLEEEKKCINCGLCSYICPSKINLMRRK